MDIKKLLNKTAATAPTSLEFQIHHVVSIFQTNKLKKLSPKNFFQFVVLFSTINNGTHATNIKKVNTNGGQEAQSNKLPNNAVRRLRCFFK